MLSMNHTTNLGISKSKISIIVGTSFTPKIFISLPSLMLQELNMYRMCLRKILIIINSLSNYVMPQ